MFPVLEHEIKPSVRELDVADAAPLGLHTVTFVQFLVPVLVVEAGELLNFVYALPAMGKATPVVPVGVRDNASLGDV